MKKPKSRKPGLKAYQGVVVGGKKITSFAQVRPKSPAKASLKDKTRTGIGLAIL